METGRGPTAGPHWRTLATVILAAGASTRFGGRPKALLPVGAEAAVVRLARLAEEAGCRPVVVVTGAHDREIRAALEESPARAVTNPRWSEGRTGSVAAGLQALPPFTDALLWPVDHMFVDVSTVFALRAAWAQDPLALWFVPTFEERGGHPVLLRYELAPSILAMDPDAPLRDRRATLGPQVRTVEVRDAGILANVDDLERYRRELTRWERGWIDV